MCPCYLEWEHIPGHVASCACMIPSMHVLAPVCVCDVHVHVFAHVCVFVCVPPLYITCMHSPMCVCVCYVHTPIMYAVFPRVCTDT